MNVSNRVQNFLKDASRQRRIKSRKLTVSSAAISPATISSATISPTTATISAAAASRTAAASAAFTTVIATTEGAAASTATAATASASAASAKSRHLAEPLGALLVVLLEQLAKFTDDVAVLLVDKGKGGTSVTSTTGTTNPVDVVVNVAGKVVVDNLRDIGDVQTTTSNIGGTHDGSVAALEAAKGILALPLGLVAVNGAGGEALGTENVLEVVARALGLDEDEDESLLNGEEETHQRLELVTVLDVLNGLGNVLAGRTDTADGEEDVLTHEVTGETLDVGGEGCREHHRLTIVAKGHALLLDDATDLRLEAHVQHAISLIEDEELDGLHGNATTLDEIDETAGSSDEHVAAALDLAKLIPDVGTTVDDDGSNTGGVGEALGLFVDLARKLTGGGEDEGVGVATTATGVLGRRRAATTKHRKDDGEEEAGGLTGTSLGTGHEVLVGKANGNGILLDRRGLGVAAELSVPHEVLADGIDGVLLDGLGAFTSRRLNGNVVVPVEVDARGLLLLTVEELTLDAGVEAHVAMEAPLIDASLAAATVVSAVSATASTITAATAATTYVDVVPARVGGLRGASVAPAPAVAATVSAAAIRATARAAAVTGPSSSAATARRARSASTLSISQVRRYVL